MVTRFYLSGQTTHLVGLALNLAKAGHKVDIFFTRFNLSPYRDQYVAWLTEGGVGHRVDPDLTGLAGSLAQGCYDIIHAHSSRTFLRSAQISIETGVPLVITCHGLGLGEGHYRLALDHAGFLICVGPKVEASLPQYDHKTRVIGNAVDLEEFRPDPDLPALTLSPRRVVITLTGRYDKFKAGATRELYEALERIMHDRQDMEVVALGNWPAPPQLDRWRAAGWMVRHAASLGTSDIVLGTGLAVREGMAAGNAAVILGRAYGGVVTPARLRESAFPNFSGWTAEGVTEASAPVIQRDLEGLLDNRGYLQFLKDWGRRCAELHFDIQRVVAETVEIYRLIHGARCMKTLREEEDA